MIQINAVAQRIAVARGAHEEDISRFGCGDGVIQRLLVLGGPPTVVDHHDIGLAAGLEQHQVADCRHGILGAPLVVLIQELDRQQRHIPTDPCDAHAVTSLGSDRPGYVGAVAVVIPRIAIVVVEVVAMQVIHQAVVVVVDPVPRDFTRVGPDIVV